MEALTITGLAEVIATDPTLTWSTGRPKYPGDIAAILNASVEVRVAHGEVRAADLAAAIEIEDLLKLDPATLTILPIALQAASVDPEGPWMTDVLYGMFGAEPTWARMTAAVAPDGAAAVVTGSKAEQHFGVGTVVTEDKVRAAIAHLGY